MSLRLEDYALIGDLRTAALVGRDGSIDWLCLPRFDADACFAALLGEPRHGRWLLAPVEPVRSCMRRYWPNTLVLETELTTDSGTVRIVDCMPPAAGDPTLVRVVEGVRGIVPMHMQLILRFDYGITVPWVRRVDDVLHVTAGPHSLAVRSPVATRGENLTTVAAFVVGPGERLPWTMTWHASNTAIPAARDALTDVQDCKAWWTGWSARCTYEGPWRDAVMRSLITLKALSFAPTGGVVAAPTMSLPEAIGGARNWDYRYCWLRDATFTLYALMLAGFDDEATAWCDWLLRAIAGDPSQLQILYGLAGERRIPEQTLDWLPGYEGSRPVRQGNAAVHQLQLDVYGEVMDAMHQARRAGRAPAPAAWSLQQALVRYVEVAWREPDEGIWEIRAARRHFTYSKVMAWVAVDRAVKAIERFGLPGPVERWRAVRAQIHADVCAQGFDAVRGSFVQSYGDRALDASLLMIPLVGFLPPGDARVRGTVEAIERELRDGEFVRRYAPTGSDGLADDEGSFLMCSFWLADALALLGRHDDAARLFERLLAVRNDVGLLAEEYDVRRGRLVGNFPQAFSHVGLINTAFNLSRPEGPAEHRRK